MTASAAQALRRRRGLSVGSAPMDLRAAFSEAIETSLAESAGNRISFFDWALRVPEPKRPLDFHQFPMQRELYQEGADEKRAIIMKGTQVGCCLDPDTMVLRADLTWIPIKEAEPGTELVAVDEECPDARNGRRKARCLRQATVVHQWHVQKAAYRLTFKDGREIVASGEHRFLVRHCGYVVWRSVRELRVTDSLRNVTTVWDKPGYEDGWMAGVLDGEGHLAGRGVRATGSAIVITQQPNAVYDRAVDYLNARGYTFGQRLEPRPNGKPVGKIDISRTAEVMRLIGSTQPSRWRTERWWQGLKLPGDGSSWNEIVAIEPLGERHLVDIETTEGTFLANGMVSHNSAFALRWILYHCDTRGLTGLYVLPRTQDSYDFSDARIKPVIQASEYLRGRISPEDPSNKGLRKVGLGLVYFRGSESKRGLDTADVDALVLDENDTLNQEHVPDAERRLSGVTSANLLRRVGVPSIPNWGISKYYEESDKRAWMVKCAACGEWQRLTFFENVDEATEKMVCSKCRRPIDVGTGQWVAEYPDRDTRGYHITRLQAPGANLHDIIIASKQRLPHQRQTFFNKDLGEPYAPSEGRLSREALQSCVREYSQEPSYGGANLVTMGIDVASTRALNVTVFEHLDDGRCKTLALLEVDSFDGLVPLMDRFTVRMCCIDHLPEGRLARSFAERFAGRVMLVSYNTNPSPKDDKVIQVNEESRMVSVRRVDAMDATAEQFRQQNILLPMDLPHGFVDAMQAPVRVVHEDELGRKTVSYRSMGQDDWFHSTAYSLIAGEAFLHRQVTSELQQTAFSQLDDHLEFQRSGLGDYAADTPYNPGGRDYDDY